MRLERTPLLIEGILGKLAARRNIAQILSRSEQKRKEKGQKKR